MPEPRHGLDAELDRDRTCVANSSGLALPATRGRCRRCPARVGEAGLIDVGDRRQQAARTFYESLGAELIVEQLFQWDGMDLVEPGTGGADSPRRRRRYRSTCGNGNLEAPGAMK